MAALEQRKVDRFVELVGMGLAAAEASRAVPISERTGDRLMQRADVKARIEELRADSGTGLIEEVRAIVDELMSATDKDGNEDWTARAKAAELLMRHKPVFEEHDVSAAEDALPEGVYEVFPRVVRELPA